MRFNSISSISSSSSSSSSSSISSGRISSNIVITWCSREIQWEGNPVGEG